MGRRARREAHITSQEQRDEAIESSSTGAHPSFTPKMKLWIVLADQVQFGYGRAQLLRAIEEQGSIRKASAQFGMSYRRVWGYLQELEAAAGFPLLERRVGGWGHGGATLTPEGRAFLTQYEAWQAYVESIVRPSFATYFPTRV